MKSVFEIFLYYLIAQKADNLKGEEEVIKVILLEINDNVLFCKYNILDDSISDKIAKALIIKVLLIDYCDNYYSDQASKIKFFNVKSEIEDIIDYE